MRRLLLVFAAVALTSPFVAGTVLAGPGQHGTPPPAGSGAQPVCGPPASAHAQCHARVVTRKGSTAPLASTSFQYGYTPADLASAYKLPASGGAGQTIAIVDAYDNPAAVADLNAYRAQFGLSTCLSVSPSGCTFGNGAWVKKVDQRGGTSYPATDVGWGQEIALDVDMASAICPSCNILLVEADSSSFADLSAAVNQAASMNATEISNSYGSNQEFGGETSYDSAYNHPGIAVTVSSGDSGYNRFGYPAGSRYVIAVGGTSLSRSSSSRGWSETAWNGAGSGCSRYESKPSWQTDSGCSKRVVADVAAVADPNTGVAVYDSFGSSGGANWLVFGGTSVSSPIIAAVYALAGNASTASVSNGSYSYSHRSSLFDVMSGGSGGCGRTKYLCTAGTGYDGPTGLGTPNGTGAF